MNRKSLLVAIIGGSGSGKTTISQRLAGSFGPGEVVLVNEDNYYFSFAHLPLHERSKINWDHPDKKDYPRLLADLAALKAGRPAHCIKYDFTEHRPSGQPVVLVPADIVIVEGTQNIIDPAVRALCDLRVFIEGDAEIRLGRRVERDLRERKRAADWTRQTWAALTQPMYLEHIEPCRQFADIILDNTRGTPLDELIDPVVRRINAMRRE